VTIEIDQSRCGLLLLVSQEFGERSEWQNQPTSQSRQPNNSSSPPVLLTQRKKRAADPALGHNEQVAETGERKQQQHLLVIRRRANWSSTERILGRERVNFICSTEHDSDSSNCGKPLRRHSTAAGHGRLFGTSRSCSGRDHF